MLGLGSGNRGGCITQLDPQVAIRFILREI